MQNDNTTRLSAVPIRNGIIILGGYGVRVSVDRRHLFLADGVGRQRREGRFAKAPARIKRLLVIGETGFVSFEALRWLRDVKATFIHLDHNVAIATVSITGLDDARLRRAQALLPNTEHCLAIGRELLKAKIEGQLAVIDSFGLAGGNDIRTAIQSLDRSQSIGEAVIAEAQAAESYWNGWAPVTIEFARRDSVPDHWRTFGNRRSPLTLRPRNAANPINAILNYLYTLLEIETRIALVARGLDLGLALFHADEANRQSLAADVMEPARPHVDAFVLNLARTRTFAARDFVETREGACRLTSALTQELAHTMTTWARLVAPHAELIARHVARLAKSGLGVALPFRPSASADRSRIKVRARPILEVLKPGAARTVPMSAASNACRECGARVAIRKRIFCDACYSAHREKMLRAHGAKFSAAGPAKIAAMRARGTDPTQSPEAARRRAASAKAQRKAVTTWSDDGSLAGVDFKRDILPKLQSLPVRVIAELMDTTQSHGSKVRNGHLIPHKRHWKVLLRIK